MKEEELTKLQGKNINTAVNMESKKNTKVPKNLGDIRSFTMVWI